MRPNYPPPLNTPLCDNDIAQLSHVTKERTPPLCMYEIYCIQSMTSENNNYSTSISSIQSSTGHCVYIAHPPERGGIERSVDCMATGQSLCDTAKRSVARGDYYI